ncbi:MAG: helix-turn-helix domain-containing protein [Firmicutes bacterium]|nr:helix-turn-helix domain-containing protein [Bacillota bacterium]
MKFFAERLKELRTAKGISVIDLGIAIGVSNAAISRWENNQRTIAADNIIKLAKYFEVPTDYLLGLIDEPYW